MKNRKPIRKKDRFEVFKRDKFKCQYCGRSAPEVILEIDHMKPIAKDGDNSIINLITACKDCNSGKKHFELSDDSAISKQKNQLDELQDRREQLKLLSEWRDELKNIESETIELLKTEIENCYNNRYSINENGLNNIKKWIKKFTIEELIESINICTKYLKPCDKDGFTKRSVEIFFDKISRVAYMKRVYKDKPYLEEIFKIRSYMKYHYNYIKDYEVKNYLEKLYNMGISLETLRNIASTYSNYSEWENQIIELIEISEG